MHYESNLQFFQKLLKNLGIPVRIFTDLQDDFTLINKAGLGEFYCLFKWIFLRLIKQSIPHIMSPAPPNVPIKSGLLLTMRTVRSVVT